MASVNIWAGPWENVSYAIYEQQRRRSACASAQSDQCLCCLLPRQNDTSSLYIRNFKILVGRCSWAGQFVSCLVGDSWRHIFSWPGSYKYIYQCICHTCIKYSIMFASKVDVNIARTAVGTCRKLLITMSFNYYCFKKQEKKAIRIFCIGVIMVYLNWMNS